MQGDCFLVLVGKPAASAPQREMGLVTDRAAQGACQTQKPKPDRVPHIVPQRSACLPQVALCRGPVPQPIGLQLFLRECFGGIGDGAQVTPSPRELPVALGLFSVPNALLPLRMVAVIV